MPPTRLSLARPICSICDNPSLFPNIELSSEIRHKFFHRECSTCEPRQDRSLCEFCRHLRIRHLFFCDLTPDWQDNLLEMGIEHFDLSISPSQMCPLCQLLTCIINREKSYFPASKEDINMQCGDPCLRLIWDSEIGKLRVGLRVGFIFYPILLHEKFRGWKTFKQHAPTFNERLIGNPRSLLKSHGSIPLHVGKKVRWDQVRRWLKECANSHNRCLRKRLRLGNQLKTLPDGFMVIDVKERKIVNGDQGCQFVALSYVWGNKPDDTKLRATMETLKRLRRRNGVAAHELPATIEDAIQICIELGEQYLWVDRLCIVQDHHKHKQHQINRMASIYASASLVIVVTEGDMESGIAGVRHKRPIQNIQPFSGSKFSYGLPTIGESIEHSRWATRGWTYQEAVLARKKLFFTPSQVYYMCESTIRSENFDRPFKQESFTQKSMKLNPTVGRRLESCLVSDWGHHLEAYTARSLRHSSDIYNAFIGICSAIYNEDDPLLCGLPRQSFDQALLWCCITPAENAPLYQIRTPEKDEDLPSWSWSSVMGKVSLNSGAREREFYGSLVQWTVKRSGDSHRKQVMHPDDPEDLSPPFVEFPPQFYLAVAWSQGCLKKPWPLQQLFKLEFSSLDRSIQAQWTSIDIFARDYIWGWDEDLEEELQKELLKNSWLRDKTLLVSCAQTAWFKLKRHTPHSMRPHLGGSAKHYHLEIVDEEGHCIGMLAESEPRVEEEVWSSTESDTFEFIALSISRYNSYDTALQCVLQRDKELLKDWEDCNKPYGLDEKPRGILWQRSRNLTFYDRDGVPLDPIPVVNVMLIVKDRRHHLLAHRVSIGWILLTQWAKAERQFKKNFLE